jgi:hypothetical protein
MIFRAFPYKRGPHLFYFIFLIRGGPHLFYFIFLIRGGPLLWIPIWTWEYLLPGVSIFKRSFYSIQCLSKTISKYFLAKPTLSSPIFFGLEGTRSVPPCPYPGSSILSPNPLHKCVTMWLEMRTRVSHDYHKYNVAGNRK